MTTIEAELNEKQFLEKAESLTLAYKDAHDSLNQAIGDLKSSRDKSYPKILTPELDYENLLIVATYCKHRATEIWFAANSLESTILSDLAHLESSLKLDVSESVLKNKNFTKMTDSLRSAVVDRNPQIRDMKQLGSRVSAMKSYSGQLMQNFSGDCFSFSALLKSKSQMGPL